MAISTTLITLSQMTEAALSGPDIGTVNFRLLYNVLQILISHFGLENLKIEFSGSDSELVKRLIDVNATGTTLGMTQYHVVDSPEMLKRSSKTDGKTISDIHTQEEMNEKQINVIDRRKDSKEDPDENPPQFKTLSKSNVVIVPTTDSKEIAPAITVALTTDAFQKLIDDVDYLKKKYKELTEMSNNADLVNAARKSGSGPILDMYQILSVTKKVEGLEEGLKRMAAMIQEVAKMQIGDLSKPDDSNAPTETDKENFKNVMKEADEIKNAITSGSDNNAGLVKDIEKRLTELEKRIEDGLGSGTHLPKLSKPDGPVVGEDFSKVDLTELNVADSLNLIQKEFKNIRKIIQTLDKGTTQGQINPDKISPINSGGGGDIPERMALVEQRFNQCVDQINSLDTMFNARMETIGQQMTTMEKEVGKLLDKVQGLDDQGGSSVNTNTIDLYKRFADLEKLTHGMSQTLTDVLDERQEKYMILKSIQEQVEMLKTVKADKSDVEAELADKVDLCMINRKVSHEQFDATCLDLTKGIEDALEKLTKQEELWQQALGDIQNEVGAKLDKMELNPLKDFITQKLNVLQGKLKALSKMKREQEAAGAKNALLRDVKCISCDKDVVMRKQMDASLFPQPPTLPPSKTMAPYLAYELDQLRKQQKTLPSSRNMNHFEQAKKGDVCNRYCGGSHTVTTPQQRVTRLGNFLEQWGPDITTATDPTMIYKSGDENVMEKGHSSLMIQGEVISNRSGFEAPEKLPTSKDKK